MLLAWLCCMLVWAGPGSAERGRCRCTFSRDAAPGQLRRDPDQGADPAVLEAEAAERARLAETQGWTASAFLDGRSLSIARSARDAACAAATKDGANGARVKQPWIPSRWLRPSK